MNRKTERNMLPGSGTQTPIADRIPNIPPAPAGFSTRDNKLQLGLELSKHMRVLFATISAGSQWSRKTNLS
jgi:hypothetical protein